MSFKFTVDPKEVKVRGVSEEPQQATINLKNTAEVKMAFKIKTTKNNRFKIRPAMGIVAAGGSAIIQVTVAPIEERPEGKDSFGIHEAPAGDESNANSFWTCNDKCEVQKIFTNYTD